MPAIMFFQDDFSQISGKLYFPLKDVSQKVI